MWTLFRIFIFFCQLEGFSHLYTLKLKTLQDYGCGSFLTEKKNSFSIVNTYFNPWFQDSKGTIIVTGLSYCHKEASTDHHLDTELFSFHIIFSYILSIFQHLVFCLSLVLNETLNLQLRYVYVKCLTTIHSINYKSFYCSVQRSKPCPLASLTEFLRKILQPKIQVIFYQFVIIS